MHITFVIPVFKDWESLALLIDNIESIKFKEENIISKNYVIVDDFSLLGNHASFLGHRKEKITIIELINNLGHQKAITVGLCYAKDNCIDSDYVVVMDSDGEDNPADIPRMIEAALELKSNILFASRANRQEGFKFQLFYKFYKFLYRMLTGFHISFGNFSVITHALLTRIVFMPDIWLHYSAGIINAKIPIETLPVNRGKRYTGQSKMNFVGLINHGLSSIAVFSELVAIRIGIFSVLSVVTIGLIGILILSIKKLTAVAIPGWTSTVGLTLFIILIQLVSIGLLLSFITLSSKTMKKVIPYHIYKDFIFKIHTHAK